MSRISVDDIIGYQVNGQIYCVECWEEATKKEARELKEDEILTEADRKEGEEYIFCDQCKKEI